LFKSLGIVNWQWESIYGHSIDGLNLRLRPRDAAKIVYLEGERLLPSGWVEESTKPWQHTQDPAMDYGFLWWILRLAGHPAYAAWGFGGQIMYVVPDLDLLVVTSGTRDHSYSELIEKLVIPAIRD
jgi:CubicO group peptidase (beta-lactamase class C family)